MFITLGIISTLCIVQDTWTVDYLSPPDGAVLEVGGMAFMSDGDMVVSTRRGQVWRIENPQAENPEGEAAGSPQPRNNRETKTMCGYRIPR